jgi:NodT family efflux transporter outer membrane factor (OMF) lipoprotein
MRTNSKSRALRKLPAAALLTLLAGCVVGPRYQVPEMPLPAQFKEAGDWVPATPADGAARGEWWRIFADPVLDQLASQVALSNQNVAAAAAAYDQARALVRQQRATLFPQVTLDASGERAGGGSSSSSGVSARTGNNYQVSIGASWEPDVWGRLRLGVAGARASAEASAADLASAQLSAQGELAVDYLNLRETDVQSQLLAETIDGYQKALQIAQNRYQAGIAPKTDVLQAQTQLANAQADLVALQRNRAQLEHAIAVLIGKAPAEFDLAAATWQPTVPQVPLLLPSTLLQRRPDIAAAERSVAAANAQIGIAQSGYYPSIGLSASYGDSGSRVPALFSTSAAAWSLGLSLAQRIFDAGAVSAQVAAARAAQQRAAALYRQTVLTAFQDVEDQLAAARVLEKQLDLRRAASEAADQAEQQVLNRYRAGQVVYTDVVSAQATALAARRTLAQVQADRQSAAVALVQALGGGWQGSGAGE